MIFTEDKALKIAIDFLRRKFANTDFKVLHTSFCPAGDLEKCKKDLAETLGEKYSKDWDEYLEKTYRLNHWAIQFIYADWEQEEGETPQGPHVSVYEDGTIESYRPL